VGMTVEEARLRLSAIGLGVGRVQTLVDPSVPQGSVVAVAESLPELPRGSTVELVVAVAG
ncbi:MAG: PASTA domain-containing protein, partial [bacterium]|nr:PASTA domain-containing protein [bacterium]